jgi:hypothetical protein
MTDIQLIYALISFFVLLIILYTHIGWKRLFDVYRMWFTKEYWTDYNIVEFLSWFTKAIIIVPGLIFKIQLWWLYFLTLFTSTLLVWASYRKLLPTLVAFNTLWIFISIMVISQNLVK